MALNFLEVMQKYNEFKSMLEKCGKNPKDLLDQELKKQNISPKELESLIQNAKQLAKIIGIK